MKEKDKWESSAALIGRGGSLVAKVKNERFCKIVLQIKRMETNQERVCLKCWMAMRRMLKSWYIQSW